MDTRTALIVGAGIGGLAAGIALQRAGWRVRILERAAIARELGFGLSLAPNAMAALRELGLAERLMNSGHVMQSIEFRRADGEVLKRLNIRATISRAPSVFALRPVLYGALLDTIGPESIMFDSEAAAVDIADGSVKVTCTNGTSTTGDVLIGADGIRSTIRRILHPHEPPPRPSGYYGIRGVARGVAGSLGGLSVILYLGHRIEAATVRAGEDAVYWYIAVPAGEMPRDRDRAVVADRCAARLDHAFQAIARSTDPEDLRVDELLERDPIEDWGRGPVTLLGDAAHPMLPQTGQGAAQALEDAVALGLALGAGGGEESLRKYERVRSRRANKVVRRGRYAARFMVTTSETVDRVRAWTLRMIPVTPIEAAFMLSRSRTDPHRDLRR